MIPYVLDREVRTHVQVFRTRSSAVKLGEIADLYDQSRVWCLKYGQTNLLYSSMTDLTLMSQFYATGETIIY